MRFQNRHPAFFFSGEENCRGGRAGRKFPRRSHPSRTPLQLPFVEEPAPAFVKPTEVMRGIIITSVSLEEVLALRCLRAVEGYVDLGMFQEAEAELSQLDPAWLASEQTLSLQMRVCAGLSQCQ